jgi:multidrug resistance efflux pump
MELLLILTYVAFCAAVFKIFKIPVNQWSLATATLGGGVGIFLLLVIMSYNHPFSANGRIYFAVTPILPAVKGRVIEVPVKSNVPLKQGDVLFRIDPKPYEYALDQKRAALAEAQQSVKQLKTSLDEATAQTERAAAQLHLQEENYDRQLQLFTRQVIAQATLDTAKRNYEAAKESWTAAQAVQERARLAYTSELGGVNPTVARLIAEQSDAEYELEQTTTRAPADGFVTQVALRPGVYVVPIPLRPAMVFVPTGERDRTLAAAFQQNALQRVKGGDEAEVAFDAVPGRVFKGKVRQVVDAIASGQVQPNGVLQGVGERTSDGSRALAIIDVEEDISSYQLPPGAAAEVAIYTEHWHHIALLRRILLRMRSWQNYVFLEH